MAKLSYGKISPTKFVNFLYFRNAGPRNAPFTTPLRKYEFFLKYETATFTHFLVTVIKYSFKEPNEQIY